MLKFTRNRMTQLIWRRFSTTIDTVNRNAEMLATIKGYKNSQVSECANRKKMYAVVNEALGGLAISYVEFGVWRGESLRMWATINQDSGSRFYGFDSFEGLPEVWRHGFGNATDREMFDVAGLAPVIQDPRVMLVKGWFQRTLRSFLSKTELRHPIVVHVDSDLHSSALYVLSTCDPLLEAGDVVIFDEYTSPSNEYLAWEEYKRAFMRKAKCLAMGDHWAQIAFVLM